MFDDIERTIQLENIQYVDYHFTSKTWLGYKTIEDFNEKINATKIASSREVPPHIDRYSHFFVKDFTKFLQDKNLAIKFAKEKLNSYKFSRIVYEEKNNEWVGYVQAGISLHLISDAYLDTALATKSCEFDQDFFLGFIKQKQDGKPETKKKPAKFMVTNQHYPSYYEAVFWLKNIKKETRFLSQKDNGFWYGYRSKQEADKGVNSTQKLFSDPYGSDVILTLQEFKHWMKDVIKNTKIITKKTNARKVIGTQKNSLLPVDFSEIELRLAVGIIENHCKKQEVKKGEVYIVPNTYDKKVLSKLIVDEVYGEPSEEMPDFVFGGYKCFVTFGPEGEPDPDNSMLREPRASINGMVDPDNIAILYNEGNKV